MALRTRVSSRGRSSRSSERTRVRWVPRFLWIPEHSMHMSAPRFRLAQVGSWERKGAHNKWRWHFQHTCQFGHFNAMIVSEVVWNLVWISFKAGLLNLLPVCQTWYSPETLFPLKCSSVTRPSTIYSIFWDTDLIEMLLNIFPKNKVPSLLFFAALFSRVGVQIHSNICHILF